MATYLDEVLKFQGSHEAFHVPSILVPDAHLPYLHHAANANVHTFANVGNRILNLLQVAKALLKLQPLQHFDVIHVHGTFAGVTARLLYGWRRGNTKLVYCSHGWAFDRRSAQWKNSLIGLVEKSLSRLTDKIICISRHDFRTARQHGIDESKLLLVKNGVSDAEVVQSTQDIQWPQGKIRLLYAGRFDRQKGIDVLLAALQHVDARIHCFAVGDASLGDIDLGIKPDNVSYTGWLAPKDLQAYMASCDVFIMPSRWEGFGLAALEAMRAGKPVIATDVGGLPELVENKVNGFVIPADSPVALSICLNELDAETLKLMGINSRKKYELEFSALTMNQKILNLYQTLQQNLTP
ncbi:glycosyltransferase [Methylobacillus sp. Pita2]|uniref:glycosyltransferase n=1 Tax=Methylobacillus sp. Pita2 TaxID=3383245 RepID=UPI0038B5F8D7